MKNEIIQVDMTSTLKGKTAKQVTRLLKLAGVKLDPNYEPVALPGKLVYSGSATKAVKEKLGINVTFFANPGIAPLRPGGLASRCRNCKKTKGDHQADTLLCPRGKKSRIGYTTYGPTEFVEKGQRA